MIPDENTPTPSDPENPGSPPASMASAAVQDDYFGFDEVHEVTLPDGLSKIWHTSLNEGGRRQYLSKQNKEITVEAATKNMKLKVESGEERFQLLLAAITGWNLIQLNPKTNQREPVSFTDTNVRRWLTKANPKHVDIVDKDVRKHNEWLNADVTLEDIAEQRKALDELEAKIIETEATKNS